MAETNVIVIGRPSRQLLTRAIVRLDSRKHPAKLVEIQRELDRRLGRAA